jgi:hypothetical protein
MSDSAEGVFATATVFDFVPLMAYRSFAPPTRANCASQTPHGGADADTVSAFGVVYTASSSISARRITSSGSLSLLRSTPMNDSAALGPNTHA